MQIIIIFWIECRWYPHPPSSFFSIIVSLNPHISIW
jgi:hypothetical protein